MGYIRSADLKRLIQTDNLNQITGNDATTLEYAIDAAVQELTSYLTQKYIVTDEIKDFETYEYPTTYYYGQRLILTAPDYVPATSYVINDLATYSGNVYRAQGPTTGTFEPNDWQVLGANNTMWYTILPAAYSAAVYDSGTTYNAGDLTIYSGYFYRCTATTTGAFDADKWTQLTASTTRYTPFNYLSNYRKDDKVWYAGKLYTAKQNTPVLGQQDAIQYGNTANLPLHNTFPNDPDYGSQYWTDEGAYTIPNQLLTNAERFAEGDTRYTLLVNNCIDIALYHLHSRIAPRNIPELRVKRYDDAIRWLKKCAEGDITVPLPLIQPKSGQRIRFASNVKQNNSY